MTKLLYKKDIDLIAKELLEGKIVAFPTDTVFGLACIYDNEKAINKIYEAKNRSISKALPMMCNGIRMINKYAYVNKEEKKIIKYLMPGALTLILKKKDLPEFVSDKDTIAIRIPNDSFILKLLSKLNKPLLVTSANISNTESLIDYQDVYNTIGNRIDYIVKGKADSKISSTVLSINNGINILRQGNITKKDIEEVLK